jgi:hypothetical protein
MGMVENILELALAITRLKNISLQHAVFLTLEGLIIIHSEVSKANCNARNA